MNKLFGILGILSVFLVGCGSDETATETSVVKLRIAGQHAADHPVTLSLKRIEERLETESQGMLDVTVYPTNQLGDYILVYEEIMKGSIDMANIFIPSQYDPLLEINSIPYLVDNFEDMQRIFSQGSYFYTTYENLHKKLGVKLLGISIDGFIGYGLKELPENVVDFSVPKSTMIRTPALEVYKQTTEDMGFPSTTIAYADLYSALQTGVVDGWVGGTVPMNYLTFRDVINHYVPYNCFVENTAYIMNQELYDSLTPDLQQLITAVFADEAANSLAIARKEEQKYLELMQQENIEIYPLTDAERAQMSAYIRNATWPNLAGKFGQEIMDGLLADLNQEN